MHTSHWLLRVIAVCAVLSTALLTFVVAFAVALTIVSIADADPRDELGFVFMVGTLDKGHAIIAGVCGLVVAFFVWIAIMVIADRLGDDGPEHAVDSDL